MTSDDVIKKNGSVRWCGWVMCSVYSTWMCHVEVMDAGIAGDVCIGGMMCVCVCR